MLHSGEPRVTRVGVKSTWDGEAASVLGMVYDCGACGPVSHVLRGTISAADIITDVMVLSECIDDVLPRAMREVR